ncbi:MAG: TonB-dependent receptor [Acidobacteria bacterium]|nr:TonB-dependent receptor [Acidobacteriota bacterium]
MVCLVACLVVGSQQSAWTQGVATGSIKGLVTDASGAGIAGAKITVTNTATNAKQTLLSESDGGYQAPNLAIGTYTVKAEKDGFSTAVNENIRVSVSQSVTVDIKMTVGSVSEILTVEATSEAPITEDKGDRSVVLPAETLSKLPLQVAGGARQVDAFLTLAPGVTGDTFSARINGAPNFSQDFYYDGIPYMNADGGGRQEGLQPPFESVDEYSINTNAYSAQYGRGAGLLNFHFKSGTNQFHGGAWEFMRNNALDALGYFASSSGAKSSQKQNEFGFRIGGPVIIPKLYDGKDKTFFSFTLNWFRFRGGSANTSKITLPTANMANGDFSELLGGPVQVHSDPNDSNSPLVNLINPCDDSTVLQGQIFDPTTSQTVGGVPCRTAFAGNIVPSNLLSTLSNPYLQLIPTATLPGVIQNAFAIPSSAPQNNHIWLLKIDHNISPKLVLHASHYQMKFNTPTSPIISGVLGTGNNFNVQGWEPRISLDHTITSNLFNQTAFSVQYTQGVRIFFPLVPDSFNSPLATAGLPYPAIAVQNMPTFGGGANNNQNSGGCWPCTFFADNLKWVKGKHTLGFGTEMRWEDERDAFSQNIGTYSFVNAATAFPGQSVLTGNGFASFYLGLVNSASRTGFAPPRLVKTGYRAFYVQDDIRVTPKLTVNIGLRWDVSIPVTDPANMFSTFDPSVPNPGANGLLGSLVYTGTNGGPCIADGGASLCRSRIADIYWGSWQPRFGFAYRLTDKTVVRGGFGKSSLRGGASTLMGPEIAASYLTGFQYQDNLISLDTGYTPPAALQPTWDVGIPPVGEAPPRTRDAANNQDVQYMARIDGKTGYTMNWNLTVERQLPWRVGFETSYVGSSSVRIGANLLNVNQVPSQYLSLGSVLNADINSQEAIDAGITSPYPGFTGTVAQALRPYPQFHYISANTQNTGHSNYHSLQMRGQKNFSDGLTFLASFTWSKTLTDGLDQFSTFSANPLDTNNRRRERQLLGADANGGASPRTLSISTTYELPIGPGKKFLNVRGPIGKIVGGWGAGAVMSYNAGSYLPITGGSANPIFNGQSRPNRVSGVDPKAFSGGNFNPYTDYYVNADAFEDAGPYALGNSPRVLSDLRGFAFYNENISAFKQTKITETTNIEFRAEFFNAFNRTVFATPDMNFSDVQNGGFGRVTGQANSPRIIQFGLKFNF